MVPFWNWKRSDKISVKAGLSENGLAAISEVLGSKQLGCHDCTGTVDSGGLVGTDAVTPFVRFVFGGNFEDEAEEVDELNIRNKTRRRNPFDLSFSKS